MRGKLVREDLVPRRPHGLWFDAGECVFFVWFGVEGSRRPEEVERGLVVGLACVDRCAAVKEWANSHQGSERQRRR